MHLGRDHIIDTDFEDKNLNLSHTGSVEVRILLSSGDDQTSVCKVSEKNQRKKRLAKLVQLLNDKIIRTENREKLVELL